MTEAYPLAWPEGWVRTPTWNRKDDARFHGSIYGLTIARARDQLLEELRQLADSAGSVVISSNMPVNRNGEMYSRGSVADVGVAVYFKFKGKQMVMARDAYKTVAGNLRSLTLAVAALRQLNRHGGGMMLERAFTGFAALTPPSWKKPWREVMGFKKEYNPTLGEMEEVYRAKAKLRHPDMGGSNESMSELNTAYAEARQEMGL